MNPKHASLFFDLFALAPLALMACGGSNDAPKGAVPADADAAGVEPGAPSDGGQDAAPIPSDAATNDAAVDDRIDPIALGRSWTYDVAILGTYPICKAGSSTGAVLGAKVVAGKPSFQVQSFCPGAGTSSYAVDGDRVEIYYGSSWILSLDSPVAEGHTWTDGVVTYIWEKVGAVTVPAGAFDDCWKARAQIGASYTTFCRGVGPVRWHYVDAVGNGYDATLTARTQ